MPTQYTTDSTHPSRAHQPTGAGIAQYVDKSLLNRGKEPQDLGENDMEIETHNWNKTLKSEKSKHPTMSFC